MRTLLPLLALLSLAACDSGGPDDALVGTWTLTHVRADVQATSRTAQTVPDRSATPSGSLSVTGATTASLGTVVNLFSDPDGGVNLAIESSDIGSAGYVQLVIQELVTESQASLLDADAGLSYNAYFTPRRTLIARTGGRFTVAPVEVTTGNETATVSGAIRYPDLALVAGQPTVLQRNEGAPDETIRFVFGDDGTFRATMFSLGDDESVSGTWERVGDNVRVTVTDSVQTEVVTFRATVTGTTLELEAADLDGFSCIDECLRFYEGEVFATPGSLSAVSLLITYRFNSGAQASARASGAPAPPLRSRQAALPILGPLVSEGR